MIKTFFTAKGGNGRKVKKKVSGDVMNYLDVLKLTVLAGEIMIKSGAEIYRTEDVMDRIAKNYGARQVESFVTPTGIFCAIESIDGQVFTTVRRIESRGFNLTKIDKVNAFSRRLSKRHIPVEEGIRELTEIAQEKSEYPWWLKIFAAGTGALFSTGLIGGKGAEMAVSFLIAILVRAFIMAVPDFGLFPFFFDLAGGFISTLLVVAIAKIYPLMLGVTVVGSIMPFIPGMSITNSIRDAIAGDFLASQARGLEAFLRVLALAVSAAVVLALVV
ncbi:threonine/serine exporter family protein [Carboxydothermus pertinax]|uniref:Threonine/serine exporter-like N-terminal domain-containing protein n=1 Tax=Carboxydothermus pertinax TaxID=870242 RepID=A0A1L8CV58_9THEO|nr:threonine/serine exporter family protein [Carboxydothermus pertinax]GAV22835.1 hypothetical protein cpu_13450 [Carboxydothermus pertinax]